MKEVVCLSKCIRVKQETGNRAIGESGNRKNQEWNPFGVSCFTFPVRRLRNPQVMVSGANPSMYLVDPPLWRPRAENRPALASWGIPESSEAAGGRPADARPLARGREDPRGAFQGVSPAEACARCFLPHLALPQAVEEERRRAAWRGWKWKAASRRGAAMRFCGRLCWRRW